MLQLDCKLNFGSTTFDGNRLFWKNIWTIYSVGKEDVRVKCISINELIKL